MDGSSNPSYLPNDSSLSLSTPSTVEEAAAIDESYSGGSGHSNEPNNDEMDDAQDFNDNDSALGGSLIGYDTQTVASYMTDYRYENGRRYHAYRDGEYWGPNDDRANDAQELAHHMYLITLEGKLHLAPIDSPHHILDVGCGTGVWAVDMADTYPSAQVVGNDISPTQPNFIPPNCTFELDDFNSPWPFPANHFDYIHIRELFGSVPDWDEFLAQAFTHTKPGGYVEIMEHSVMPVSDDTTAGDDSILTIWGKTAIETGEMIGKSFTIWKESKERMERAGFVDIIEVRYKWPMNDWPSPELRTNGNDGGKSWQKLRELGIWNQLRMYYGVEGYMLRLLTTIRGWTYEAAQDFLVQMQAALMDTSVHAYQDVSVVYGRKPGGTQQEATVAAAAAN